MKATKKKRHDQAVNLDRRGRPGDLVLPVRGVEIQPGPPGVLTPEGTGRLASTLGDWRA